MDYKKINKTLFETIVLSYDWDVVIDNCNIDGAFSKFAAVVRDAIERSTPVLKRSARKKAPWSNKCILNLSKKKRCLWRRYNQVRPQ